MVSSRPEPEWDDTERDWMLALADVRAQEEADRCSMCGLPLAICRAKSAEGSVPVDAERCHVTTAVVRTREQFEKDEMPYIQGVEFIPRIADPSAGLFDPEPSPPSSSRSPRQ